MSNEQYPYQVALLLQILPLLNEQDVFALKGGTAINLFIRDMPRLLALFLRHRAGKAPLTELAALLVKFSQREQ